MKALIGIASCHVQRHYADTQRETWVKDVPEGLDVKFFIGNPNTGDPKPDEVFLDVGDGYRDCTAKTIEQCKWALEHEYDFMFKADLDTLIRPVLLFNCGYENHDYMGGRNSFFASGGAGYWLSRRAMKCVIEFPIETTAEEDVHVARALSANGINLHADERFKFCPGDIMDDRTITFHLSSVKAWGAKYTPEEMLSVWKDQKDKNYKSYGVMSNVLSRRSLRLRRFQ